MAVDEWLIRPGVPDDESCIVSMWLNSLCKSMKALEAGFAESVVRTSDDYLAWWAINQPIITALVRTAGVRVLCDPERADYRNGPAIIWGWLVAAGDTVYGCCVKRNMRRASLDCAIDIATDLLGNRLHKPQVQVIDLYDLRRLNLVPRSWTHDELWWPSMRGAVQASLYRDPVSVATLSHIADPKREPWVPNSQRAA